MIWEPMKMNKNVMIRDMSLVLFGGDSKHPLGGDA